MSIIDQIIEHPEKTFLFVGSACLIVTAFVLWFLFYARSRAKDEPGLTDGAVLLLADGMVQQASQGAVVLFGNCVNQPVVRVLDEFLGSAAAEARDAVNRLEMTGDPLDLLVHTADGRPYELIGSPSGALIRLVLRDARLLDDRLRDAEERLSAADSALNQHEWAQETLNGLIQDAPIIAWHRQSNGSIDWSGGEIKTRSGSVFADQAVDLIVARTKLNRNPVLAGQPQKSRIEIVVNEGAESVSLHVIEIVRPDGTRIGFATDAGTAASAERTLTRFVQTMTETFAHLTVGLAIFDRNQTLALFNPALVQMWQVEPAWLARRPSLRDIIDELRATRRLPELQDFHKWRTRLIDLFENTEAADYEELWHLADGSNIRVLARPHPHGSLAFIFDDVTERMRLEQRYRHSIDLRRATLDRLTEGIAVFGANGLLQFVNQAFHEIWGTDNETVYAAMHARQLVTLCEDMTVETEVWHRLHSYITGEENRRAWTARLTMGPGRVLTARFAPLPDGSTMAVFSDITDSERISMALNDRNEALEMADAMRATVLEQVSYQLKAPLSTALNQAQNINRVDGLDEQTGQMANNIIAATEQALDAMAELTDLTTQPVGPPDGQYGDCDLSETLGYCVRVLQGRADQARVDLQLGDMAQAGKFNCDFVRLRQIAFNLIAEAIDTAIPGGKIEIGGKSHGEAYEFSALIDVGPNLLPVAGESEDPRVMALVQQLALDAGGTFQTENVDGQSVLVTCKFTPSTRRTSLADNAGNADQSDNVHPLRPGTLS